MTPPPPGTDHAPAGRPAEELIGVYHADGGVLGELRYALGRLRGTTHCALCDVTHGGLRRRPDWDELVSGLGLPFRLVHLNERDVAVQRASRGGTPCVLARTGTDLVLVLGPVDLDAVAGDVRAFAAKLRVGVQTAGLTLP